MVPSLFACIKDVCEAECHAGTSPKHALTAIAGWLFVAALSACVLYHYYVVYVEQWRERKREREHTCMFIYAGALHIMQPHMHTRTHTHTHAHTH